MSNETWTQVDDYILHHVVPQDDALTGALQRSEAAGMPSIAVAPNQGKLLMLLAMMRGARTILEVGTLGGYSTIWLARALPPGGRVVTLEANATHAGVARDNLKRAGLEQVVEVIEGKGVDTLPTLVNDPRAPFDLVFIDADKPSNSEYVSWALKLTKKGSVIIVDNVVRSGNVVDATSTDASVVGVRKLFEMLEKESRLSVTAVQTVGSKGYDGFALALVL